MPSVSQHPEGPWTPRAAFPEGSGVDAGWAWSPQAAQPEEEGGPAPEGESEAQMPLAESTSPGGKQTACPLAVHFWGRDWGLYLTFLLCRTGDKMVPCGDQNEMLPAYREYLTQSPSPVPLL